MQCLGQHRKTHFVWFFFCRHRKQISKICQIGNSGTNSIAWKSECPTKNVCFMLLRMFLVFSISIECKFPYFISNHPKSVVGIRQGYTKSVLYIRCIRIRCVSYFLVTPWDNTGILWYFKRELYFYDFISDCLLCNYNFLVIFRINYQSMCIIT